MWWIFLYGLIKFAPFSVIYIPCISCTELSTSAVVYQALKKLKRGRTKDICLIDTTSLPLTIPLNFLQLPMHSDLCQEKSIQRISRKLGNNFQQKLLRNIDGKISRKANPTIQYSLCISRNTFKRKPFCPSKSKHRRKTGKRMRQMRTKIPNEKLKISNKGQVHGTATHLNHMKYNLSDDTYLLGKKVHKVEFPLTYVIEKTKQNSIPTNDKYLSTVKRFTSFPRIIKRRFRILPINDMIAHVNSISKKTKRSIYHEQQRQGTKGNDLGLTLPPKRNEKKSLPEKLLSVTKFRPFSYDNDEDEALEPVSNQVDRRLANVTPIFHTTENKRHFKKVAPIHDNFENIYMRMSKVRSNYVKIQNMSAHHLNDTNKNENSTVVKKYLHENDSSAFHKNTHGSQSNLLKQPLKNGSYSILITNGHSIVQIKPQRPEKTLERTPIKRQMYLIRIDSLEDDDDKLYKLLKKQAKTFSHAKESLRKNLSSLNNDSGKQSSKIDDLKLHKNPTNNTMKFQHHLQEQNTLYGEKPLHKIKYLNQTILNEGDFNPTSVRKIAGSSDYDMVQNHTHQNSKFKGLQNDLFSHNSDMQNITMSTENFFDDDDDKDNYPPAKREKVFDLVYDINKQPSHHLRVSTPDDDDERDNKLLGPKTVNYTDERLSKYKDNKSSNLNKGDSIDDDNNKSINRNTGKHFQNKAEKLKNATEKEVFLTPIKPIAEDVFHESANLNFKHNSTDLISHVSKCNNKSCVVAELEGSLLKSHTSHSKFKNKTNAELIMDDFEQKPLSSSSNDSPENNDRNSILKGLRDTNPKIMSIKKLDNISLTKTQLKNDSRINNNLHNLPSFDDEIDENENDNIDEDDLETDSEENNGQNSKTNELKHSYRIDSNKVNLSEVNIKPSFENMTVSNELHITPIGYGGHFLSLMQQVKPTHQNNSNSLSNTSNLIDVLSSEEKSNKTHGNSSTIKTSENDDDDDDADNLPFHPNVSRKVDGQENLSNLMLQILKIFQENQYENNYNLMLKEYERESQTGGDKEKNERKVNSGEKIIGGSTDKFLQTPEIQKTNSSKSFLKKEDEDNIYNLMHQVIQIFKEEEYKNKSQLTTRQNISQAIIRDEESLNKSMTIPETTKDHYLGNEKKKDKDVENYITYSYSIPSDGNHTQNNNYPTVKIGPEDRTETNRYPVEQRNADYPTHYNPLR